ncbi:MAG: UDP binding domain-containing protein [Dermatophilaceae bacterium]
MNYFSVQPLERDIQNLLTSGACRAGVWGLGYIGRSTFAALLQEKVTTVGFDIDASQALAAAALVSEHDPRSEASTDDTRILQPDVTVHFIAVPTERHDQPCHDAITDVFGRIVTAVRDGRAPRGVLVIVESTLAPGTTSQLLLPIVTSAGLVPDDDILIALAPRRDWLTMAADGLRTIDRVFGGIGPRSCVRARTFLSLMSDTLHEARTHVEAELTKCVENAYRHIEITLANQLSLAYPEADMVDVLRLAGTKWNMQQFHPSFGTGGYCIPLAGRYLLQGSQRPEMLTLITEAIVTDDAMRQRVIDSVAGTGPVLILGLAYKTNAKVATLSPTIDMARRLRELEVEHSVHDPLYTPAEILRICGSGAPADLAEATAQAGAVVVVTDHPEFRDPQVLRLLTLPRPEPLVVLDNYGGLSDVAWPPHVHYWRAGTPGWLTTHGLTHA